MLNLIWFLFFFSRYNLSVGNVHQIYEFRNSKIIHVNISMNIMHHLNANSNVIAIMKRDSFVCCRMDVCMHVWVYDYNLLTLLNCKRTSQMKSTAFCFYQLSCFFIHYGICICICDLDLNLCIQNDYQVHSIKLID